MTQEINKNLKFISMKLRCSILIFLVAIFAVSAQTSVKNRVKVDGVAVVVGKNIVLDSDVDKFKKELAQRIEGKIDISDCEIIGSPRSY